MRMRGADTKGINGAQARVQLTMMLANARSLDSFTAEMLARTHKIPLRDCEYALTIARQKRASQERTRS